MTIYPTPGSSTVYATSTEGWLVGEPNYNYVGYPGNTNTVTYQLATGPVNASLQNPSINTGDATGDTYSNIQNLTGSPYGGLLQGSTSGQTNQLWALGGNNLLEGGTGFTTFIPGPGADAMWASQGGGYADYEVATSGLVASLANPSINTGWAAGDTYSNIQSLGGSAYDDVLWANNSGNNLLGQDGDNVLIGGTGSDTLSGGPGANILIGHAGSDWFVFGGSAIGPGDVNMDPLSVLYNAEAGVYSRISDFDQGNHGYYDTGESDRVDVAPLVSVLNDGGASVGALVQIVEDTSGTFAWLEFHGPMGWATIARMDGLQAGETVGVILNESNSAGFNVTVQGTQLTSTTSTDEWILENGQWSASISPGSYPGPDEKVVGVGNFFDNGTDGILWYNVNTGDVSEWQLQNGQWAGSVDFGAHPGVGGNSPGPGWQVEGVGDFNGDGTSDVLWYNAGDNQIDIWELQNGQWAASANPGTHPGVGEEVAGTGDFYNNGTGDILWYNVQSGDVDEWQISNGQWAGSTDLGSHGSGWQVAGVGKFFGSNAASDVLWFNSGSGQTDIWEMQNGQWAASVSPGSHPGSGWEVAGVGDFNSDGTSDILWYNVNSGAAEEWLITNGQWAGTVSLGEHAGGVAGVGAFTGPGTTDILWAHPA
jgi:RTX calcium-binding nonapeptide repeat (4 copies)